MLEENIVILGLNHKSASLHLRESVSFSASRLQDALKRLLVLDAVNECLILSTCNRVEIYAAVKGLPEAKEQMIRFLEGYHGLNVESDLRESMYFYTGVKAIEHLFSVASGLDSMVIGETQILGQVKAAYKVAYNARAAKSLLNMLFQSSFRVAKKIRSSTNISEGVLSLSSAAVDLGKKIFGGLSNAVAMVIGTGEVGELTVRKLISSGARSIIVSNRNYSKALKLASLLPLEAIKLYDIEEKLMNTDIVIVSTCAPHYIIKDELIERIMLRRKDRPILLIDLSVPRNVDPRVSRLKNAFLYNIDGLNSFANTNLKEKVMELNLYQSLVKDETRNFCLYLENYAVKTQNISLEISK